MTTVLDYNIRVIGVDGTSDDADVPVRDLFRDSQFKRKHRLCSINSINWFVFC
jgi:threonine synthase